MKFQSDPQFFEKYANNNFHENPSSDSRVPDRKMDGRTDRHDEAKVIFVRFSERASKIGTA